MGAGVSLQDIEAIKQLKARYFRFLDTKQWDRWGEVFTPDAVLDVPINRDVPLRGRAEIVATVSANLDPIITIHHGHMPEIEILAPGRARGIWPMYDLLLRTTTTLVDSGPGAATFGPRYEGYGHYVEQYTKGEDGQWRIAHIELRRLHLETERHRRDVDISSFESSRREPE
jgi:ketosteroid isomerase-like protein